MQLCEQGPGINVSAKWWSNRSADWVMPACVVSVAACRGTKSRPQAHRKGVLPGLEELLLKGHQVVRNRVGLSFSHATLPNRNDLQKSFGCCASRGEVWEMPARAHDTGQSQATNQEATRLFVEILHVPIQAVTWPQHTQKAGVEHFPPHFAPSRHSRTSVAYNWLSNLAGRFAT